MSWFSPFFSRNSQNINSQTTNSQTSNLQNINFDRTLNLVSSHDINYLHSIVNGQIKRNIRTVTGKQIIDLFKNNVKKINFRMLIILNNTPILISDSTTLNFKTENDGQPYLEIVITDNNHNPQTIKLRMNDIVTIINYKIYQLDKDDNRNFDGGRRRATRRRRRASRRSRKTRSQR
jgi:hypothetical protein